ncbi:S8 family serine peptidase [Candidatus Poribacteria bacterium]|nr:S8 family serine peptidase [Candidatus Poribacteria bacterium]
MVLILSLLIAISSVNSPSERIDGFLLAISQLPLEQVERLDFVHDGVARVLIKLSGPIDHLPGAKIRTITGTIASAEIALSRISDLATSPHVLFVQPAIRLKPCQEWIRGNIKDIGADLAHRSDPAFTGRGTIIGVIDTGIDWSHPDFANPDGSSKILYIWDQTVTIPGKEPADYGYGSEWSRAEIQSGVCREMDTYGHGTHVSGVASSVAPDAQIIAVKSYLFDDQVIDGVNYVFKRARELGMPAVVNMSFGGQEGPHDGRSLLDQGIQEIIKGKSGRAAVASAGNDGDDPIHAGGKLPPPENGRYPYLSFTADPDEEHLNVEIWYSSSDSIKAKLLVPDGRGGFTDYGWVKPGDSISASVDEGMLKGAQVYLGSDSPHPLYPDLNRIQVWIWDGGDMSLPLDRAKFMLELDGAGVRFDAYTVGPTVFTSEADRMCIQPDGEKTIASPASAPDVIAVASYAVTNSWPNIRGDYTVVDYARIGRISVFSSRGPLRNGGRKPDVAAPGQMIGAALSEVSWQRPNDILPDGRHVVFQGTSMAAPHVSGAISLLLEKHPDLTPSQVKLRIIASSLDMGKPGWDELWGYGKLRVPELLNLPRSPSLISIEPGDGKLKVKWTGVKGAAGYILEIDGKGMDVGDETEHVIDGLENDKPVRIRVIAYNGIGFKSSPSEEMIGVPDAKGLDLAPPLPPRSLWLLPDDGRVMAEWEPCPEPDVAGYKVYWGDGPGRYMSSAVVKGSTKYLIDGLENGVEIYVAVSAFDTSGNESELSREISTAPRRYEGDLPRQMPGSPFELEGDSVGSPLMVDLTGDGPPELIVTSSEGEIQVRSYLGGVRMMCDRNLNGRIRSEPITVDLDGDGLPEIVAAVGNSLYALSSNGDLFWRTKFDSEIYLSPAAADIDGDGKMEIILPLSDGTIDLVGPDGESKAIWRVSEERFCASPAIADIDGDGFPDVIIPSEKEVYAISHNGEKLWEYAPPDGYGDASPIASDFNGDGSIDVVFPSKGGDVYMMDSPGEIIWVNRTSVTVCGLSAGDLDGDGLPEIVASNEVGEICAWKADGKLVDGFPVQLEERSHTVPLILDLDGDRKPDLLVGAIRGDTGLIYGLKSNGELISGFPLVNYKFANTPAVGDLDGDGDMEIAISTMGGYVDKAQVNVWDLKISYAMESVEWGMPRKDGERSGFYPAQTPPGYITASSLKPVRWGEIKSNLLQNYPNPFNPETWIPFILGEPARVTIGIYDLSGRLVWRKVLGQREAGVYLLKDRAVKWDGRNLNGEEVSSGLYIYTLQADSNGERRLWRRRMMLIR